MKSCLFVYGTLLDEKIRNAILGYDTLLSPGILRGFRMSSVTLSGTGYPILMEDRESEEVVEGGYFELNEEGLQKMDAYESEAYRRKQVRLENGMLAWVYCK